MGYKETDAFINKLRLVVYGLLAVPLLVFVVVYLRTNKGENLEPLISEDLLKPVIIFLFALSVALLLYSFLYFSNTIKKIRLENSVAIKFNEYYRSSIIKFSILESVLIISLVGLFISGNKLFIILFLVVIFIFSVENPSIRKLFRHIKPTKEEKERLLKIEDLN